MKNEPVISYNHMQDEENAKFSKRRHESIPISLYMLLVVDVILITAIVVFAAKVIF